MKKLLLSLILFGFISCNKNEKPKQTKVEIENNERSKQLLNHAKEIFFKSNLNDDIKTDSSLVLTNKAIELNKNSVNAYVHKNTLLFIKKDLKSLIDNNTKMIELKPNIPNFYVLRSFYYELKGDTLESIKFRKKAIEKYNYCISLDSLNFDLKAEYIMTLEGFGDTIAAKTIREGIKNSKDFTNDQKFILEFMNEDVISKAQLLKFWKGEIEYNQLAPEDTPIK